MSNPIFVLDANMFIQASREYYAFDIVPKFWDTLILYAEKKRIESIDRIEKELERGKDDLAQWANEYFHSAFISTDESAVITSYGTIMDWVTSQKQFTDAAKAEFAKAADGWLIAYAKTNNRTIVTHEVLSPDIKRKVPIPNVCKAFSVAFVDTFRMLRELGVQFT